MVEDEAKTMSAPALQSFVTSSAKVKVQASKAINRRSLAVEAFLDLLVAASPISRTRLVLRALVDRKLVAVAVEADVEELAVAAASRQTSQLVKAKAKTALVD